MIEVKLISIFIFLSFSVKRISGLSCKDDLGKDVDWFIIYKFPTVKNDEYLSDGTAYSYLTALNSEEWILSKYSIDSENSMLGKTWKNMQQNEESATYLFYNDEVPENFKGSSVGHLKGYFIFNNASGFWIRHSIPKFGDISHYEYPENAFRYGQYVFCVNYKTTMLNEICQLLLYCSPKIYLSKSTECVMSQLEDTSKSLFTDKPSFIRKPPFVRISSIESAMGEKFWTFAKDNQLNEDIYASIIANNLQVSLIAETWRNGAGVILEPNCQSNFTITDATIIDLTATNQSTKKTISFKSTDDHSKWSVSTDENFVCFSDLNRMKSQETRGGGAICFRSNSVWKNFYRAISETDNCPISQ